jgi:hypothetical protein
MAALPMPVGLVTSINTISPVESNVTPGSPFRGVAWYVVCEDETGDAEQAVTPKAARPKTNQRLRCMINAAPAEDLAHYTGNSLLAHA